MPISRTRLELIMGKELGPIGVKLLNRQFERAKITESKVEGEKLDELCFYISEAMVLFVGKDKSDRLINDIKRQANKA